MNFKKEMSESSNLECLRQGYDDFWQMPHKSLWISSDFWLKV